MLLATVAAILAGAISITETNACPTGEAVSAELDRLGALAALQQVGTAEVAVGDSQLHIVIRDRQGIALGGRDVDAPVDCAARASLAAVLIAAWTGKWIETNLGKPAAAPNSEAKSPSVPLGQSGRLARR